ncbi:hypothetical protein [Candidatus Hakubella thermalkaliphila]|uniref:Peptidase A2 domain-containing protein n=1 Tax=Candidatus Hakubella thermalkaliphila TaxID=2754717 RepID=A0A6V8P6N1_9ACTN|nr:hypothetical protein [Candidatus Hakubella thermalkaliphila]GFP27294.1 hypothetical protein HKBW3S33_00708 [Candidatus Hakubella thermalkaliphila]
MIEFDYRQERLRTGEIIFRPVAKVYLLRSGSEWIAEYFYIDSGADYTLIPYRMGRFLGLERKASEVKEIGGIGGVIGVRFAVAPMKIEKHQFGCTIAWAQIERVPFLLGRENVFGYFDITFQQRNRKTIFVWQRT